MKDYDMNSSFKSLPTTLDTGLVSVLSMILSVFMIAVSLGGLLFPPVFYHAEELRDSFLPNDIVNLLVGAPGLLGSMWLARRGRLIGLLCWPGALLYVFYNYFVYLLGLPLSWVTLVYGVLVGLSACLIFTLLKSVDRSALKVRLAGAVSEGLSAGVLILFGVAFFFLALGVITEAIKNQTVLPMTEIGLAVADMILSVFLAAGGVMLFQRKPLGYASGLGLLFGASALFVGVILIVFIQPMLFGLPFVFLDVIVLTGMGLVCFIPTGLFMRGVISRERSRHGMVHR
jgi:hypothetical protein